jgi:hypothetical protein
LRPNWVVLPQTSHLPATAKFLLLPGAELDFEARMNLDSGAGAHSSETKPHSRDR